MGMKKSDRITHLIQLDVLKSCKWNCAGCFIDRDGQNGWLNDDEQKFLTLCREWELRGDYLKDLVVGPTDFMSAQNTEKILSTSAMQETMAMFTNIIFATTLLDNNRAEWGSKLAALLPSNVILRPNIVLDYQHIDNRKS